MAESLCRVAAYCRVSTDKADQINSFTGQQRFFREYVQAREGWTLVDIYADEGLSGTETRRRQGFLRMMADAQQGRFDLIVTKEVSRFARNTLDTLRYTRQLREIPVYVLFLNDNIHTGEGDAELRLTIMASLAQEESRRTSQRVKWGQKRRMEQGVVFGRSLLGYDVRGGRMVINPRGAAVVRQIFELFAQAEQGVGRIARELTRQGVPTPGGASSWSPSAVLRILKNEKYCGDLVQKKTVTLDYLTHKKKTNLGQEEKVVLRGHHPPIVSRELYERVQAILAQRRRKYHAEQTHHSARLAWSGKLVCARCGRHCVARLRRRADGTPVRSWRCYQAVKRLGCTAPGIRQQALEEMLQTVLGCLGADVPAVLEELTVALERAEKDGEAREAAHQLAYWREKRRRLEALYLDERMEEEEFLRQDAACADSLRVLQGKLEEENARPPLNGEMKKKAAEWMTGMGWEDAFARFVLEEVRVDGPDAATFRLAGLPAALHCQRRGKSKG